MADKVEEKTHFICDSNQLVNGGKGIRFMVSRHGEPTPAFVVRFRDQVHAYLNLCAHQAMELDWNEGDFFDRKKEYLICATHGARYYPDSGRCAGGQCAGRQLVKLEIEEQNTQVFLRKSNDIHLIA
ncbi:MAG: Rieske 2Fe-2S domain-containing protein [Gammaproteobacteria bacterium]|nr:Rieske 2Fe-2S domain-containing protein [Gammaproteobacteria bacterium]